MMNTANAIEHSSRRTRTDYPGASYLLPSDATEKERLELQHSLYKAAFDGKLILAPVTFESGDRVLDCGTGTGIWILQLAEIVREDILLQGIDIENRLFPQEVPHGNVSFSVQSVLSFPDEWKDTFKFVHQRLFITALKRNQWASELRELYKLLTPGGWLQLSEPGPRHAGEITDRVTQMINSLYAYREIVVDIWDLLPTLLKEVGFVKVVSEERQAPMGKWAGPLGEGARDNYVTLFRAMKAPILDAGGFGVVGSEDEFDSLISKFHEELDETPGAYVRWFVVYGQKP